MATLSPSKYPSLSRSPSSPSLAHAVGLPPPIPETPMPATPTKASLKRTRDPATPSRKGDVSESDDQVAPKVRAKSTAPMSPSTPKRKVVNAIEGTPRSTKKRDNLQSRLAAAAGTRVPRPSTTTLTAYARTAPPTPGNEARSSDKVIVCMRIKPTTSTFQETAYELSPTSLSLADAHPNVQRRGGKAGREAEYTYTFDTLLQYPSRTPELYENKIAPLVDKAMRGFNSTVFAYGQTGSGKSHTMSGTREELGIIPCAVDGIFDAITADTERAFLLRVSYLEIYNEAIRDLLNFKKGPLLDDEKPSIHTAKGKITVDPLVEEIVSTPKDVVDLLDKGNTNRKTGATDWNERSSRSHAVFTIVIESRPRESEGEDEIRVSKLTLIDLAGSEKAVSDVERRGEGKHINQSLLALREVVHKLTEKGKRGHIPYRNSKLTHLLENVLGGDSNICVICTMSADEQHCPETLETLKFAGRCSQVETKAQKNILLSSDRAVIRAKDLEIAELKKQLESMGGRVPDAPDAPEEVAELKDTLADMEARKAKLVSHLAKLNGEILTSELPRSGVGLPVSTPRAKRPRISDFTSLSSGIGIGLGTPTPKKAFDRRAVSNMVRVPEEAAPPFSLQDSVIGNLDPGKTFDNDIQLAALRRTIATKDSELSQQAVALASVKEDAEQLPTVKADLTRLKLDMEAAESQHAEKLRAAEEELDKSRALLAESMAERLQQIESLEASILDLRKSREELVIEDQERLDKVQAELDRVQSELAGITKLRDTQAVELAKLREDHGAEIAKVKEAIRTLRAQADEHASKATSLAEANAELGNARDGLAASLESAIKDRDEARSQHSAASLEAEKSATASEARVKKLQSEAVSAQEKTATLETSLKAAMAKLGASEEQHGKLDGAHKDLIDKLAAAEERNVELSMQMAGVESRLGDSVARCSAAEEGSLKVSKELSAATEKLSALESSSTAKITSLESETTTLRSALTAAEERDAAAKTREAELCKTIEALKAENESKSSAATELADKLKAANTALEGKSEELATATAELASTKTARDTAEVKLAETTSSLHTATEEITALRAGASVADSVKTELAAKSSQLDTVTAEKAAIAQQLEEALARIAVLEKELAEIKAALEAERSTHGSAKTQLEEEAAAHKDTKGVFEKERSAWDTERSAWETERASTNGKVESLSSRVAELETQLEAAKKAHDVTAGELATTSSHATELQNKLSAADKSHSGDMGEADKKLRAALATVAKLELEISSAKDSHSALAADMAALQAERESSTALVSDLQRKVEAAEAESKTTKEKHEANLATLQSEVDGHKQTRALLEDRQREHEAASSSFASEKKAREQLATAADAAKAAIASLEKELGLSHTELAAARARNDRLAAEIVSLSTSQPAEPARRTITGSTSVPDAISSVAVDALRGKGEMTRIPDVEGWKKSHELEEIDQLDKVVEAQKAVITEQRHKIQLWSEELEKQREVVRLLTQDGVSPSASEAVLTTPQRTHMRGSLSMSSVPSPASPSKKEAFSPAPPGYASSRSRGHISSSFTARNLALPSAPTPLPMHDRQQHILRKARRITIEHDMDRLQEKSKVNRLKSVFDSPEKEEIPPPRGVGSKRTQMEVARRRL